jgi:hypothetical protein
MRNKIIPLFGFPTYISYLGDEKYDKKKIIKAIENNYKINKKRNCWEEGNLHHSLFDDKNNNKYNKINLDTLKPIYHKHILKFIDSLKLNYAPNYHYEIVNYTCMDVDGYMPFHIHKKCDFAAVHYLQYDNTNNNATRLLNPLTYLPDFIESEYPNTFKKLDKNVSDNSFMLKSWVYNTQEDDLLIFPASLRHDVSQLKKTNKLRITISLNITLNG